ncbi:protein argonaute 5-like isoform X1 [Fagus crenata]
MSRRRGRRGRGRGAPPPEAASSSEDSALTAWNSAPPPPIPASSSSSVASLASEVQSKLTLQDPAPVAPPLEAASSSEDSALTAWNSAPPPIPASSSSSVASLNSEVQSKLTLQDPAPVAQALSLSQRPGYGTVGKKVMVCANHFLVKVANTDIHQYDVSITPEILSKKVNRNVISQLNCDSHLGNRAVVFDGRKSIFTSGPLPFTSKEFVVKLENDDEHSAPASSGSVRKEGRFLVAIKLASKAGMNHLQQFLMGMQPDIPQETIQALDIVPRALPSETYTVVGRSFYALCLGPKGELGDGIDCWRGYYQSLRTTQMGLSLNIDVSARAFYEPLLVTDFVAKHFNFNFSRHLSVQDCLKIKKALRGIRVELTHRENSNSYIVAGVSTQPISQLMFTLDDNKTKTSVVQYFRDRYNIFLQYVSLPALQAGSDTKPVYLPMEVCKIVAGQRYSKRLNERQIVRINNFSGNKLVNNDFGIQVGGGLATVEARVLPSPMLNYHETGRESRNNLEWGRLLACVNFSIRVNRDLLFQLCDELVNMCNSKGMVLNQDPLIPTHSVQPNHIERALIDIHKHCAAKLKQMQLEGKQLQLLIIILPDVTGQYGKIKRICETELGIVSQCCQPRQVVASMDWPEVTKYRALVSTQLHREEIILDLYKQLTILKRVDSVSEGQFSQVLLYEVDAIRKACLSLEDGYLPVTFVVVRKDIIHAFFLICHRLSLTSILSHAGIQVNPWFNSGLHYHVYDENNFSADLLQVLTNNLCYTSPVYYAYLAAFEHVITLREPSEGGSTSGVMLIL